MNDGYVEDPYTSPFHTDDEGELPRNRYDGVICPFCGGERPTQKRLDHHLEYYCEERPANWLEDYVRWLHAGHMANGGAR